MKIIVSLKVAFNTVQVNQRIIELLQQKKATCHALSTGNGITLID
jgi:hypothetical protein